MLTATDQKLQKSFLKDILPTITSPECQSDAEYNITFLMIFAVFDSSR